MYILNCIKNIMLGAQYPEEKVRAIMIFLGVTIKTQEQPSPLARVSHMKPSKFKISLIPY